MAEAIFLSSPWARIGRFWFKNRGVSPIPFFLLMIALPADFEVSVPATALLALGIVLAEALRLWAVGYAGSGTRTRGETVAQLVHAGPYRHTRNPLYLANIALYTLCSLLFGFVYLSVAIFLFSCTQYIFIVSFEEEILRRSFGTRYETYQKKVPRWWFSILPRCAPSNHMFGLRGAIRSERSTLLLILIMGIIRVAV